MKAFLIIFIFFTALISLVFSFLLHKRKFASSLRAEPQARRAGETKVSSFSFVFLTLSLVLIMHGLSVLTMDPQVTLIFRKLSLVTLSLLAISYNYSSLTFVGREAKGYKLWLPLALLIGLFLFSLFSTASSLVIKETVLRDGDIIYLYGSLGKPFILALSLALAGAIANLEWIYRSAKGSSKWRVKFLVWGLIWGLAFYLFFLGYLLLYGFETTGFVKAAAISLALSFYPAAYAILRRRALDIGLYVSRQVAYGSLVVVVLGTYFTILGLVLEILNYRKVSFSNLAFLAFFLSIVGVSLALSEGFRRRAMYFVSRHFYSRKYDYRKVWSELTEEMSNYLSLESIIPHLAETVAEVVGAKWAAYFEKSCGEPGRTNEMEWKQVYGGPVTLPTEVTHKNLWKEKVLLIKSSYGNHQPSVILSLSGREEVLGLLVLGPKISNDYDLEDIEMLQTLSEQAGVRVYQAKLTQEMASFRELESLSKLSTFLLHDLKNVASMLSLILKNAPRHLHDTAFQEDLLSTLKQTEEKIQSLMTSISIFPGELELQPDLKSLTLLLAKVVGRFAKNQGVDIELQSESDLNFYFDEGLLEKLLTNVILNATQAIQESGKGGKIKVEARTLEDSVVVKIEDDGPGLPEGFVEELFKPFRTTKKGGVGIGLYQSKLIAEAHGGKIQVKSPVASSSNLDKGRGTEFIISIPVNHPSATKTQRHKGVI